MNSLHHSLHDHSDVWEWFRHDILPLELDALMNNQKTQLKIQLLPLGTPGITCGSKRRDYIDTKDVEYNMHGVSYILFLIFNHCHLKLSRQWQDTNFMQHLFQLFCLSRQCRLTQIPIQFAIWLTCHLPYHPLWLAQKHSHSPHLAPVCKWTDHQQSHSHSLYLNLSVLHLQQLFTTIVAWKFLDSFTTQSAGLNISLNIEFIIKKWPEY